MLWLRYLLLEIPSAFEPICHCDQELNHNDEIVWDEIVWAAALLQVLPLLMTQLLFFYIYFTAASFAEMMSEAFTAFGFIAFPFIGSVPGGMITKRAMDWYDKIKKPSWRPPKWAFGPVWTSLYASMGYASYMVWKEGGGFQGEAKEALMLYAASLAVNWSFTPVFFGAKSLKGGLICTSTLWGLIVATGLKFYRIVPLAGYLFIPYLIWDSLATALNFNIWMNNPKAIEKED